MEDALNIQLLLRANGAAFGFIPRAAIEKSIRQAEAIIAADRGEILGMIRYHHRRDKVTTLHEIAVMPSCQGMGIGRRLMANLEEEARRRGQTHIRLKCPLDLPANGFYAHLGFTQIAVEEGKHRPLAVWEKQLLPPAPSFVSNSPSFFVSLTHGASEIRRIVQLWDESGDQRDPFAHVIFTPLFSQPGTIALIRHLKERRGSTVMFDSGGYQVQMGRMRYEELIERLLHLYREHNWADWFVLPDHVPLSTDSLSEVERKVHETVNSARLFLEKMGPSFAERTLAVIHGRTEEQIAECVKVYTDLGIRYLGFGSFGTSGPSGTINRVSRKSLSILQFVQALAQGCPSRLHVFGIGSPHYLIRLRSAGVVPASFDSAGWWKAAGFGKVFFPGGLQIHITAVQADDAVMQVVEREKRQTQHQCTFCADPTGLRHSRTLRAMHNLAAMLDTIEKL